MTNAPDASALPPGMPEPGEARSGATVPDGPSPEADFDFWRDVIGDDIVSGGVVYSSDLWTHDPEDGVRRLTGAEIAVREAARMHPDDPEHPDVVAAHAALDDERDTAMRIERMMEEAIDQWRREYFEEELARDEELAWEEHLAREQELAAASERPQQPPTTPPADFVGPSATRPVRRRFRGARRLRRFIRR